MTKMKRNAIRKSKIRLRKTRATYTVALFLAAAHFAGAQDQRPALLTIEVDNVVGYIIDSPDQSKFGTDPKIVPNAPSRDFVPVFWMADVTAVNGKPAKGTWTGKGNQAAISPAPTAGTGTAIGDSPAALAWDWVLEIQNPDGTPSAPSCAAAGVARLRRPVRRPRLPI